MEPQLAEENGIRIAVEGCGHGTLDAIYASVERTCAIKGWPSVDLLIIGGDFQSVRNAADLSAVSMPAKYRAMHDFHEYYSGARTAPYLTVFVGGNHEASNYLFELYYGGWVAPNIYYMGAANVLRLGPLRIAGLSGIWKGFDYKKGHHERLPYNNDDVKSIYHVREIDVRRLMQIRTQVDVGISHDWPRGVEWKGDYKRLWRHKQHLEEDAQNGQLGSVAARYVMDRLRPGQWFSAHLHCKYAAVIDHEKADDQTSGAPKTGEAQASKNIDEIVLDVDDDGEKQNDKAKEVPLKNNDEIDLDMDDAEPAHSDKTKPTLPANSDEIDLELEDDPDPNVVGHVAPGQGLDDLKITSHGSPGIKESASAVPEDIRSQLPAAFSRPKPVASAPHVQQEITHPPDISNTRTQFLALDKCLPNRDFLQLLTIPSLSSPEADTATLQRPLKLEYDTEFLAITRALSLAQPLVLGQHAHRPDYDQGEQYYLPLIQESEKWVAENIPDRTVPENFELTAPVYDHAMGLIDTTGGPKEYSNNQTNAYCAMLGIDNGFDISEEEREERKKAGPRPEEERRDGGFGRGGGRGGFGRGGGFGGRGRGGRGGGGGGRGRGGGGRVRGRGRGGF